MFLCSLISTHGQRDPQRAVSGGGYPPWTCELSFRTPSLATASGRVLGGTQAASSLLGIFLKNLNLGCAGSCFSSCGEQGYYSCGALASHWGGFPCCRAVSRACALQWLWCTRLVTLGMWDLSGPGIELVFLALTGRYFSTETPGKPLVCFCNICKSKLSKVVS